MATTPYKTRLKLLITAGLMLAAQLSAQAQGMPPGRAFMASGGMLPGPDTSFERPPGPAWLHGIKLTEEQQDKVFAIMHAEQPQLREQMKALRKAREALHAMRFSTEYDDAKARALTDAAARAMADSALLRLRGEQEIYALLTAQQRKQMEDMKEHKARAGDDGAPDAEPDPPIRPPQGR